MKTADNPEFVVSLPRRARLACCNAGLKSQQQVRAALLSRKFYFKASPQGRTERNFGRKSYVALCRWAGLTEYQIADLVKKSPPSPELVQLRRMVQELATCEWQGKDVTTQRLIFEARKFQGWSEAEIMR